MNKLFSYKVENILNMNGTDYDFDFHLLRPYKNIYTCTIWYYARNMVHTDL